MDSVSIDGLALGVVKPATVAELCALVKSQRAKKEAVYPVGGRTMLDLGLPPTKPGVAVDTTALNAVIDYPARDMTITVQAGITFAKLQEVLAQENQWLPLDVPDPERMTLGGLIACNVSGPRRYGYGTLRDYLIGIEFVNDDGAVIHGGGRVVKNVAGYDLMKLNIGALGTMGVITQVTLKVLPRPETKAGLFVNCYGDELDKLHQLYAFFPESNTRPAAVFFFQSGVTIAFEGKADTVEWQRKTMLHELDREGFPDALTSQCSDEIDGCIQASVSCRNDPLFSFVSKLSIRPSLLSSVIIKNIDRHISGEVLNGIVWIRSNDALMWEDMSLVFYRAPTAWKTPERVFGKPTPAWELMSHIKRTLDPENLFNPGRMFL